MSELQSLLARVEAATGPDRELDTAVYEWSGARRPGFSVNGPYWTPPGEGAYHPAALIPSFTVSLDAALALVGRVLPGRWVSIERTRHGTGRASIGGAFAYAADGATPALALLAAMLGALIASPPTAAPLNGPPSPGTNPESPLPSAPGRP